MAILDLTELSVPAEEVYDLDYPTRNQENLANVNLQIWAKAQANGYILDDGQIPSEELSIWETMWDAQNDVLIRQSDYLDEVKSIFNEKANNLPETPSFWETVLEQIVEEGLEYIAVAFGGLLGYFIYELGWVLFEWAVNSIKNLYSEGGQICDKLRMENNAISSLPMTRDNYRLRSQIITQHDVAIGNIIQHIGLEEQRLTNPPKSKEESSTELSEDVTELLTALIEAVKALQFNGQVIRVGDLEVRHVSGQTASINNS